MGGGHGGRGLSTVGRNRVKTEKTRLLRTGGSRKGGLILPNGYARHTDGVLLDVKRGYFRRGQRDGGETEIFVTSAQEATRVIIDTGGHDCGCMTGIAVTGGR